MQDFKKLMVWQRAHHLTLELYRSTRSFPTDEKYGLTSQIRRAAGSVEANIAEGCGRGGKLDFARFLRLSLGSASELECHLLIARDLHFLNESEHAELEVRVVEVKRMLTSLMEKVRHSGLTDN